MSTATTTRAVFDRVSNQVWMVRELQLRVRNVPHLGLGPTEQQRVAWIREVIERNRLADMRVRASKSDTWSQLFERATGEAWE